MNRSPTNTSFAFQPISLPVHLLTDMNESDEQPKERPQPAPSIANHFSTSYDYVEKGFRKFYQRSLDSPASGSNDSSPTTTISTVDDSSATEPSPGSSPESPPSSTLAGGMLRAHMADDNRPFFELQKQPLPKKGRNLKNLAVNTSRTPGKGSPTGSLPLPSANNYVLASDAASAFVKPHTPNKRKPSNLGLTLLTPAINKAPPNEIKIAVPQTPSFAQSNALRHFQSAPSLPLEAEVSEATSSFQNVRVISTLDTILSPSHNKLTFEDEEEQNFDIPLSQEEKTEAYPQGPLCVYEPYIDLYLEPTVAQAREYDVIMNVASEVRNPFTSNGGEVPTEPEIRIDGGGGIQYAPKRDRIPPKLSQSHAEAPSPATPQAAFPHGRSATRETESCPEIDPEYIHVKWEHNSDIVPDLLPLVKLMDEKVVEGKRILVHCQCGVSRSASLVVAYGLYKDPSLSVQEAYDAVKKRSKWIGPNMNLIMQLQEFRTSLMRGGLLSSNRDATPITPSSALSEWRGPFATLLGEPSGSRSTLTAPLIRPQSAESMPALISGPLSAPSSVSGSSNSGQLISRARATSAAIVSGTPITTFVNPRGRLVPAVPVVKVADADVEEPTLSNERTPHADESVGGTKLHETTPFAANFSTEHFATTPLQPSPDVDPGDDFGLMSPTTTEFASSSFDRAALLANLGMGSLGQQPSSPMQRTTSLRTRQSRFSDDASTPNGLRPASRLRGKVSAPDLGEQRRLPVRPANIEASLSNRDTESPSLPHMEDLLLSPRATEFTQNPFALAMGEAAESPQPAHAPESDPRSPAQKGGSPITRNILDVL